MGKNNLQYGIGKWSIEDLMHIYNQNQSSVFSSQSEQQIINSRNKVENILQKNKTVYGVNTGFGPLCDTKISKKELQKLQFNLLISHAVGVGEWISKDLSKKMLICKLHALSRGFSGVSLAVVKRIDLMLNKDLIPCVPAQGSVGASGDLAPLSHLFLPLLGKGYVWQNNSPTKANKVLKKHQLLPIELQAKDGLALINGTQFILAHAIKGLVKFNYLLNLADVIAALSVEAFQGSAKPFNKELHNLRPFKGSQLVAQRMRNLLKGSKNLNTHSNCIRVQDPYSMRCIPQVHGASRNAYFHLKELTEIELNSVTDNPIIISDEKAISGGNFHGQPLAIALDYATIAASEIGNISDRRQYLLLEGKYGLPRLLTEKGGLNSGFMIPQYTSAALTTENKTLCYPASADSIPTSLGQEDHVSMGSISGRKFNQVLNNVEKILAIELLYACQGLEFRRPLKSSQYLEKIFNLVRTKVPKLEEDREIGKDIHNIIELIQSPTFKQVINQFN